MVDMTNLSNITSLQGLASYTNTMTDGILFTGGMVVFFVIMIMVLLRNGEPLENVLAVASWSMFIVSSVFWLAHLVSPMIPLVFLFLASFSVLYLYSSRR